ncbi:MAG: TolC family protein, partial [Candidatus Eremiobacteraeota bacterium]|nr:TolC family protein [Candidatus Eremiobacteraeota bacterium]
SVVSPRNSGAPRTASPTGAATLGPAPVAPLSLGDAARLAAVQSANSEEARDRIEQARGRLKQSRAALLPSFSGLGSQNQRTFNTASFGITFPSAPGQPPLFDPNGQVAGPVNIYDFRARLASTLFDLGARERVRASQTLVRAGTYDAENQGQIAAANAAVTYVRVLQAESQLENRVADSVLAGELLTIARQQLLAGTGVALDVTRAQSQLAATRASLIAARNSRDRARLDLNRAVGVTLDQTLTLTDRLPALPIDSVVVPDEAAAERIAAARRADLRVATAQAAAAQQSAHAIRAERYPALQAFADDGNTGTSFNHLLNTYTYGVQVSWPIFNGGLRQGREQEQRAAAAEFDVRARDLQTQTSVDVRSALLDLRSAREQVGAASERLQLAEQEVTQARDRFRAGVSGNADVITASQTLTSARTGYVDALTAYQNARVSLARAEGTVVDLP